MDEVQAKCESVVITKHGKPIAKLVPVDSDRDDFYGFMKEKGRVVSVSSIRPFLLKTPVI